MSELPLSAEELAEYIQQQRWFGSKARKFSHFGVLATALLAEGLYSTLVEVRFQPGTHEVYQLPVGLRPESDGWSQGVIGQVDGQTAYDALTDPARTAVLLRLLRTGQDVEGPGGRSEFRWLGNGVPDDLPARPVGAEQSNSSIVYGDALVLKLYRRVEAGVNPELELLRFLTERDFPHIPRLSGWYAYAGEVMDATLGVLQEFRGGGQDGWDLALEALATDPDSFLAPLRSLGEVTGRMHAALASDASDPSFAPEEPSVETTSLITATVDEEIESVFVDLPHDVEALEPIRGRGEEVRDRLRLLTQIGPTGKVIRHHGDYHLGQTLLHNGEWLILDFEGEPARSLPERRRKRSPLRDVAGMLRSFAYAASAAERQRGVSVPEDWEHRAREEFLAGYTSTVDPSLLPPGETPTRRLLSVFELEKAIYELRYELNNRPDWVEIPVAGIERLLEEDA